MGEKHKKYFLIFSKNVFKHFLIFISAVSGCVSISAFASLVGIPVGIFAVSEGIKKYKSITKKKILSFSVISKS